MKKIEVNKIEILKKTKSICSVCFNQIASEYAEEDNKIYFYKYCPEHGISKILISNSSNEYKELFSYYSSFGLEEQKVLNLPPDQISIFPTTKCNLKCPVCFADCGIPDTDISIEDVKKVIRKLRNKKINILGGEATVYQQLPLLIKTIIKSGNTPILFTNGIKITDYNYLRYLNRLGIEEIHLQFDGMDDNIYLDLRNRELLKYKLEALENLRKSDINVVLESLIDNRVNSCYIGEIIYFALRYKNIKGINFRTYFVLGKKEDKNGSLLLDEMLDLVETQTASQISRKEILEFQKILYAFASIFSLKICMKHRFFIIYRKGKNSFTTINKMFNLECLMKTIEKFKELKEKKSKFADIYLCLSFLTKLPFIVSPKNIPIVINYIVIILGKKLLGISISKRLFKDKSLMVNFERPCDNDTYDLNETCDNMVIDCQGNNFRTFYLASIAREKLKRKIF